jgi:periplasmic nitrate reductase NapD
MSLEIHISGIAIHTRPADTQSVLSELSSFPSAQVHAVTEDGRLVITLETESTHQTLDYMDAIRSLRGVLNVVLVYQHAESATALDEEVEP